jgi:hypothetical protein
MFAPLKTDTSNRQAKALAVSLATHGLLFGWLLYASLPKVLAPLSVRAGEINGSLTQLYWPANASSEVAGDLQAAASLPQEQPRRRLLWKQRARKVKPHNRRPPDA